MGLPCQPVTLTPEQVADLSQKLSTLRHNVNNNLSLIVAASELIRFKPEMARQMAGTLGEQPPKIMEELRAFSATLEKSLNITRE
ncbi:MAG: hypothetical protein WCO56_02475 [Verrucomicrobiota bacterium]